MTEDELDILASSYLDGEATSEEMAMVEADPTLLARVREFDALRSAVGSTVPVPRSLKEQQLAAALARFNGEAGISLDVGADDEAGRGRSAHVIDLTERRAEVELEPDRRWQWLSAAAAVMLLVVGAVFVADRAGGGDDASEVAVAADDAEETESADEGDTAFGAETDDAVGPAAGISGDDEGASIESEAMAVDAEEELADEESESLEVTEDDAADEAADGADSAADADAERAAPPIVYEEVPPSGFFPDEPVVTYPDVPTGTEIVNDRNLRWRDTEFSRCAPTAPLPDGADVIGHLPIEVTNPDGSTAEVEALYLVIGRTVDVLLVDPVGCDLFG